jgi:hypothetical protein
MAPSGAVCRSLKRGSSSMAPLQWLPMTFGRPGHSITLAPDLPMPSSSIGMARPGPLRDGLEGGSSPRGSERGFHHWDRRLVFERYLGGGLYGAGAGGPPHRAALERHNVDGHEPARARARHQHSIWSSGAGAERRMGGGSFDPTRSSRGIAYAHLDRALGRKLMADRLQSQRRSAHHLPIQPAIRSYGIEPDRHLGGRFLLCREWLGRPVHAG